jgi:hypothetical protein
LRLGVQDRLGGDAFGGECLGERIEEPIPPTASP